MKKRNLPQIEPIPPLPTLTLEQLDVVAGGTTGNDNEWRYVPVRR